MSSGIGVRIIVFHNDGSVKRISHRRFDAFYNENEIFMEYAGKSLKCAFVVVDLKNRKPVQVRAIDPIRLYFESDGSCNQVMVKRKNELLQKTGASPLRAGNSDIVVDLASHSARKQLERDFSWKPTRSEIKKIFSLLNIDQ